MNVEISLFSTGSVCTRMGGSGGLGEVRVGDRVGGGHLRGGGKGDAGANVVE